MLLPHCTCACRAGGGEPPPPWIPIDRSGRHLPWEHVLHHRSAWNDNSGEPHTWAWGGADYPIHYFWVYKGPQWLTTVRQLHGVTPMVAVHRARALAPPYATCPTTMPLPSTRRGVLCIETKNGAIAAIMYHFLGSGRCSHFLSVSVPAVVSIMADSQHSIVVHEQIQERHRKQTDSCEEMVADPHLLFHSSHARRSRCPCIRQRRRVQRVHRS